MTKKATGFPGNRSVCIPWNDVLVTALLFLFGILRQPPALTVRFPGSADSGYLSDGVRLIEQGTLMPPGSGPLAGILNGIIYLFFPRDYMLLGDGSQIRRILLLIAILSAAALARWKPPAAGTWRWLTTCVRWPRPSSPSPKNPYRRSTLLVTACASSWSWNPDRVSRQP
jgi:hypothetical protein